MSYTVEQRQLAAGDQIAWTRNLPAIGVANGQMTTVTAVHPASYGPIHSFAVPGPTCQDRAI